ncbi:MAG: hypothetical protein WCH83_16925, partial [Alphaproteobacteria bacterium]
MTMPVATNTDPVARREALRHAVSSLEKAVPRAREGEVITLGAATLDLRLGGGLARGGLHAVHGEAAGDGAAAIGFTTLLAARAARLGSVLWVQTVAAKREGAALYGPGLAEVGLDPRRLTLVRAARDLDALWAAEEALGCGALAAVVVDLHGPAEALDLTASRRLALAAARSGVTGLLLRTGSAAHPAATMSRFLVAPAPSRVGPVALALGGLGPPRFTVTLDRNRAGETGRFVLEWTRSDHAEDSDDPCFRITTGEIAR